jgi:uncharacterized protein (UPF0335 family)
MKITDEIYSRLNEKEVKERIELLEEEKKIAENNNKEIYTLFQEFIDWRKKIRLG